MAGMTDAKLPDAQAGFETMQNLTQCILGGAHIINECLGVLDSIMTNSFEKFVMDEEMMSRVFAMTAMVPAERDDFMMDTMAQVGPRGTYLTHPSTFQGFRTLWRPSRVSTWDDHAKWEKDGSQDALARATQLYKEKLAACPETTLSPEADAALAAYID